MYLLSDVENYTLRLSLLRPTSYRFAQCDVPLKPFLQQSSASSDIELLLTGNTGDAEMPFAGTLRCSVTSDVRTGVPSGVPISGPSPVQELQATVVELGKRVADAGVKVRPVVTHFHETFSDG